MDFTEALKKLAELQTTDSGLDDLDRVRKGFQKEAADIEASLSALQTKIQNEKKALDELLKARKVCEMEVGGLDSKIQKYQGQESEVKSNEQFAALKQEIEKSKEEKSKSEEKVLEILFKEDTQRAELQRLAGELAEAEKLAAKAREGLRQKIADCEKAAQEKKAERVKQLADLPPELAQGYEALRGNGKKIALAQIREDLTCSGCHMSVPPQTLNEIRKNIGIQRCNCGRYLYEKV